LWAYFAQLLVSSVLDLGLERYAASAVAASDDRSSARIVGTVVWSRLVTAPMTPLALGLVLTVVRVHLGATGWAALVVWTLAVQWQGSLFAALRGRGDVRIEATTVLLGRLVQCAAVVVGGIAGADAVMLLALVAAVDVAMAARAWLGASRRIGVSYGDRPPYRLLATYTLLEVLVFAYLRADLLIVGRLLGAGTGATYGLAYRFVDALVALSTPALLVLFAHSSEVAARGAGVDEVRRRVHGLLPHFGVLFAAGAIASVGVLSHVVPRIGDAEAALRILLAVVPMTYLIAAEALMLSAEGRNRSVLRVAATALAANVALNVVFVPHYGMVGAAVVLAVCELGQASAFARVAPTRGLRAVSGPVALLFAGAVALNVGAGAVGLLMLAAAAAAAGRCVVGSLR
jgi:O-antigen/teichoic acid export membrane protein